MNKFIVLVKDRNFKKEKLSHLSQWICLSKLKSCPNFTKVAKLYKVRKKQNEDRLRTAISSETKLYSKKKKRITEDR